MFIENKESRVNWFNGHSDQIDEFELLGIVTGLAIYNGVILDLHFPLLVYKKLLGWKVDLEDINEINPALHKGLKDLMESENVTGWDITFQIRYKVFGMDVMHNLVPNGSEMFVNNENKIQYVNLYVQFVLEDSIKQQFDSYKKGFDLVASGKALQLCTPEELQLLICGNPELNFEELEKGTTYEYGYFREHSTISNFWELVHNFNMEEKKKFLFFATGSDRAPVAGLSKLKLTIAKNGEPDRLPTAMTCFNYLLLPPYESRQVLEKMLTTAINNSQGFGLR